MNRREALSALAGASLLPGAAQAKLAQTISADAAPEGAFDIVAEFPESRVPLASPSRRMAGSSSASPDMRSIMTRPRSPS